MTERDALKGSIVKVLKVMALVVFIYFGWLAFAYAADGSFGEGTAKFSLFDELLSGNGEAGNTGWQGQSAGWQKDIVDNFAKKTFKILAAIEFAWAALYWAFQKDNLSSLSVEIIKKIMIIQFFFFLLINGPEFAQKIIESFSQVGTEVMKLKALTTDGIIATGLAAVDQLWEGAPSGFFSVLKNLHKIIMAAFSSLIVLIAFVIVAAQWLCIMVESFILLATGAIFLAFGASSVLRTHTEKYFSYAINVGVRLLVLTIIVGLMVGAGDKVAEGYDFEIGQMLEIAGMAIVTCLLAIKAPEMASSAFGASFGLSAGGVAGSAQSGVSNAMSIATGAISAGRTGLSAGRAGLSKAVSTAQGIRHAHQFASSAAAVGGIGKQGSESKLGAEPRGTGSAGNNGGSSQENSIRRSDQGSETIGTGVPQVGQEASVIGEAVKGGEDAGQAEQKAPPAKLAEKDSEGNDQDSEAKGTTVPQVGQEASITGEAVKGDEDAGHAAQKAPPVKPAEQEGEGKKTKAGPYLFHMGRAFLNAGPNGLGKFLTGKDYLGGQLAKLQREQGVSADSSSSRPGSLHVYRDLKRLQAKTGQIKPSDPPKGI